MKVKFIHHSCYTIELEKTIIVFDYTEGELLLPKDKDLIFVVTHGHGDHFHPDIFQYKNRAKYLISTHVESGSKEADITWISPDEEKSIDDIKFHAYGSTDEGISVLVEAEGKKLYHSGDLNFWLWPRYMAEDIKNMAHEFMGEVDKAKDFAPIDVLMAVVDPRMGDYYHLTGQYFLKTLTPKHFFPLHLWEDFALSETFAKRFQKEFSNSNIHSIKGDGEEFIL